VGAQCCAAHPIGMKMKKIFIYQLSYVLLTLTFSSSILCYLYKAEAMRACKPFVSCEFCQSLSFRISANLIFQLRDFSFTQLCTLFLIVSCWHILQGELSFKRIVEQFGAMLLRWPFRVSSH
jgi:hypothetical protein